MEHVGHVHVGGRDEHVDTEALGTLQCLAGPVDVAGHDAREGRDDRPAHRVGDLADGLELAVGGDREPGLDDVDVQAGQLLRDLDFFGPSERDAGRLLAVAERRVEDADVIGYAGYLGYTTLLRHLAPPSSPTPARASSAEGPSRPP